VQLDAVAHRNHRFRALVVVEDVTDRLAGLVVTMVRRGGKNDALAVAIGVQREVELVFRIRFGELGGRGGGQFCWNLAVRFDHQLSIGDIKAERRIGFDRIGVLAGKRLQLSGSGVFGGGETYIGAESRDVQETQSSENAKALNQGTTS
jgi:hypothetical protein